MSPDLHGEGVLLTPWRQEDLTAIVELADDPASRAWSASLRHVHDVDGAGAWLAGRSGPDRIDWAVRDPDTGRLVGRTGLHRFDDRPPGAELGYGVHPAYRRRGPAVAAARTATRYGFEQLGLTRIELVHASGNFASCAVATRAGFAYEGTDRASMDHGDGVLHDAHRHARLAADPPGPAAAVPRPLEVPDLDGAGVRLRPWTAADAETFARGMADPLAARWSTAPQPFTAAHALRMFDQFRRRARDGQSVPWAVESDGLVAGALMLRSINTVDMHASTAYWVLPEHRGRGIAPAALRLASGYAFDVLELHRVQLQHAVANLASCRVAEKAGFGLESVQRGSCLVAEGFLDEHQHVRLSTDG
ncbi:MAG TPA: GNAT family N-acetyltransferase [Actinomycetes bacterium]|nr:GNAT family N-acetyltransferase [Actinomycetes bacterium]